MLFSKKIWVMVVDDLVFMRWIFRDILEFDFDIEVCCEVCDGIEVIEKVKIEKLDVIIFDIEMFRMNGFDVFKFIMSKYFILVIMVSVFMQEGVEVMIKVFEYGVIDFIFKLLLLILINMCEFRDEIIVKVKEVVKVFRRFFQFWCRRVLLEQLKKVKKVGEFVRRVVVIVVFIGGFQFFFKVFEKFFGEFDVVIFFVQYMFLGFIRFFVVRFDRILKLNVKEVEDGEVVNKDWVYVVFGDYYMEVILRNGKFMIKFYKGLKIYGVRLVVDLMMKSVVEVFG